MNPKALMAHLVSKSMGILGDSRRTLTIPSNATSTIEAPVGRFDDNTINNDTILATDLVALVDAADLGTTTPVDQMPILVDSVQHQIVDAQNDMAQSLWRLHIRRI